MSIERFNTNSRMSQQIVAQQTVYLSGQVPGNTNKGFIEQTQSVLSKIDKALNEVGSDKSNIVAATIYLKDIQSHFSKFNAIWEEWVETDNAPTRTCVQAHMARKEVLVEITVIAIIEPA